MPSGTDQTSTLREVPTVTGTFPVLGSLFFDRLAPLYLVALIAEDLQVSSGQQGLLALTIGLGWAGSLVLARLASGRWGYRRRILVAAAGVSLLGVASAMAGSWTAFIVLRGLGGLLAGTAAPPITALAFAAAPVSRRGLDLGVVQSSTRLLGSLVSPVVVTAIAATFDWRAALLASSGFVTVSAVTLMLLVPSDSPPTEDNPVAAATPVFHPGGKRNILICTVSSVALVAWLTIVSQGAGQLLQGWLDLGVAEAGRLLGIFGLGAWLATLIFTLASDRIGRRAALTSCSLIGSIGGLGVAISAGGSAGSVLFATVLMALAGVAMGGLPLTLSIIPAEAVATGDVGRALAAPIIGAEILGSAALPAIAFAAGGRVGLPIIFGTVAALLLLVAVSSLGLRSLPNATQQV